MLDKETVEDAMPIRRLLIFGLVALILLWLLVPVVRAGTLMFTPPWRGGPGAAPADLAAQTVRFPASDGVNLRGWFLKKSAVAPTIILVAGFKEDRRTMSSLRAFFTPCWVQPAAVRQPRHRQQRRQVLPGTERSR